MSSSNLDIKTTRKKIAIAGGSLVVASTMALCSYGLANNLMSAKAKDQSVTSKITGDYIFEDIPNRVFETEIQDYSKNNVSTQKDYFAAVNTPATYDSRALGYVSRQENQAGEGLCWAYSFTTAAESYLLRTGLVSNAVELSPKQLDYALAPASEALSDSTSNKYVDFIGNPRELTGGGNHVSALIVASGKYSLTRDDTFFNKMKLNDPNTLGSFNSYGDFISNRLELYLVDFLSNGSTNLPLNYTTKQKSADVFNRNDAEYAVTGAEFIDLGYYSSGDISSDRENAIAKIKSDIMEYGAVAVATHYNEDSCMDKKDDTNYTIIDRTGTFFNECGDTGHGVTLVGWDDNWAYKDKETDRTGAFIVQNSYGNDGINYYLSYNSYAQAMAITDMQAASSFSDIFDVSDFDESVTSYDYEVKFDVLLADSQKLSEIVVSVPMVTKLSNPGWDIYVRNSSGEYEKVSRINDGGSALGFYSIKNLDIDVSSKISIKIKYDTAGVNIIGLDAAAFEKHILPLISAVAYTKNHSSTPTDDPEPNTDPTPTDDPEPNGTVTWVQGKDYEIGSGEDLIVRVDYPLNSLTDVALDGKGLSNEYYETKSGSTILTIYSSFLDTLDEGNHTIRLAYNNNQTVDINFVVSEADLPVPNTASDKEGDNESDVSAPDTGQNTKKGENGFIGLTLLLPIIIVFSAIGFVASRNRKHIEFENKQ